ncbi:MAG: hypothetical protein LUO89_01530, partial [Methanothrix sp.]|nr:hypothetical protein [Methanothrix sp.]
INPSVAATNLIKGPYDTYASGVAQTSSIGGGFGCGGPTFNGSVSAQCAIDVFTGKNAFNETNVPGGTAAYGPMGEWLRYSIGRANSNSPYTYLTQWNNTKLPGIEAAAGITAWGPGATNQNMSTSYDWNVTLDRALPSTYSSIGSTGGFSGSESYNATTGLYKNSPSILFVAPGNFILGQSSGLQTIPGTSFAVFGTQDPYTMWAINLNPTRGPIGHVLFYKDYPAPAGNKTVQLGPVDADNMVFTTYFRETLQWNGFDVLTGAALWGPTEPQNVWNYYSGTTGLTNPIGLGYGHLYTAGYSGILYAINTKTGNVDFTYGNSLTDPTNSTRTPETVYGEYPTQVAAVANNKVYLVEEEHSLNAPAYHGAKTRCVDAFSGKLLWEIYGISSWQEQAVADGYYTWLNLNDGQIYAMGPGPSATTVSASPAVISKGNAVEILGTVTDQTPVKQLKGTAAVSDASQEKQMEYLIQNSIDAPMDTIGVPVTLFATDSSGATTQIGQVTSTSGGIFHMLWTPPAQGEYVITAAFSGSQSYGPSSAQTAVGVTAATPVVVPTPTPTGTTTPVTSPTPSPIVTPTPTTPQGPGGIPASTIYAIAAAAVVIVIVAVAAVALRRRK